jgi:ribosomal protein L17
MFSADEIVVQAARQGLDQALQAAARAAADTETRAAKRKLSVSPAPKADQTSAQSASSSTSSISAITTSTSSSANKALRPEPAQIPSVGGSAAASLASESEETPTAVQQAEDLASPDHEFLLFLRNELRFQLELIIHFMNDANYISISDLIADLLENKTKLETDTAVLDLCQGKLGPAGRLIRALRKRLPPQYKPKEGGYERIPESDPAL